MKIRQLIDSIRINDLVLPEFQREYVWSREQAKQLMVSLVRNYPVGSLLFWTTDKPPELKNIDEVPEKLGAIQIILDGQQRLTTLYMLITGEIPPFYTDKDITTDPRDLYFHLYDGDFQYYQASRMRGNPLWCRVVDCFDMESKVKVFDLARQQAENGDDISDLAERYSDHLTRLRQVAAIDLPVQTVPVHATVDESIDIFDRVNSRGTKLTDADLALTHVTGKWPQARREMKAKIGDLSTRNFYFGLTFMTRALTGVVTKRALFEHIHKPPKDELLEGWEKLTKILDYLVTVLPSRAQIHSTEDVNTTNAFIPLVVYLAQHDAHFPDEVSIKQATHWLYAALLWSRYTAQTDQRLEHDVSLVQRPSPWTALREQIVDQRGRIEVKASDLEGRGAQHPLHRMTYVMAKTHNAIDWFNGAPLGTTHGKAYRLHSHHIFPTSVLYQSGFDSDNHLHRKLVNEIANRAFLTADTNLSLSATLPEDYLPQVEDKYPGALAKQFIPMNPELWRVDRYLNFLQARREMIACKINEYMDALIAEPEVMHERSVPELITLGESATLEFKSTLQWDVIQNRVNKDLRFSILKTIAAFLNSAGGTLIIGVEDNGTVFGLGRDLKTVKGHSLDGYEQLLSSLIGDRIGTEYAPFVKIRFEQLNGESVCAVDVEQAQEPAFIDGPRGTEFYIRHSNTTRALDPEETHRYVQMNWE
jgi:hypothetical protein